MAAPVDEISGVWRFERRGGETSSAVSPPGHLLHYIVAGRYRLDIGRRRYEIEPGDVIYYDSCEKVECRFHTDLVFYSASFQSRNFEALPPDHRVLKSMEPCRNSFVALEEAFRSGKRLEAYSALFAILAEVERRRTEQLPPAPEAARWRRITEFVKTTHDFHPDLRKLCRRFGVSASTLRRDARKYAGTTPNRCFKLGRMAEARSLLRFSDMNISEIALFLGYKRIHEFSREYAAHFGQPPSADRRRG